MTLCLTINQALGQQFLTVLNKQMFSKDEFCQHYQPIISFLFVWIAFPHSVFQLHFSDCCYSFQFTQTQRLILSTHPIISFLLVYHSFPSLRLSTSLFSLLLFISVHTDTSTFHVGIQTEARTQQTTVSAAVPVVCLPNAVPLPDHHCYLTAEHLTTRLQNCFQYRRCEKEHGKRSGCWWNC